jgi:hypothetical protein
MNYLACKGAMKFIHRKGNLKGRNHFDEIGIDG